MSSSLSDVSDRDYRSDMEEVSTIDSDILSTATLYDASDSSGVSSCSTITGTFTSEQTLPQISKLFRALSEEHLYRKQRVRKYSTPGSLLAKLIERLKSFRKLVLGSNKSHKHVSNRKMPLPENYGTPRQLFRSANGAQMPAPKACTTEPIKHKSACSKSNFSAMQMDLSIMNPTIGVHEFRCRFPSSFLALITNYLGYLCFSPEDTKKIQNALIKESKALRTSAKSTGQQSRVNSSLDLSLTTQIRTTSSKDHCADKELEHWYTVVHTLVLYLLEGKRYKQRFILRKPGNQSNMNELERKLFPPRINPWSCSSNQTDEVLQRPAVATEIVTILEGYDTSVLASVLARVLRHHGIGLIPRYLRNLFFQLVNNAKENEIYQRRAIRLLFQLVPTRLLLMVIRPVLELLAGIANEPTCEVDESSLAVLFSPILFSDQSTTTPASLANPVPARAVELLVRTALRDLQSYHSLDRTFQVPVLFQEDCVRNLTQHMILDNPQISCSLRHCACKNKKLWKNRSTQTDSNMESCDRDRLLELTPKMDS